MALALPLAILDTVTLEKSIANYTDGNITTPKSLLALGDAEFGAGARPHAISEWVGLSPITTTTTTLSSSNASLFTRGTFGSDGSTESNKCTCIQYSPVLGATQTWDACVCWNLHTTNDGNYGDGCACARIVCNTVNIHTCNVTSLGGVAPKTCSGSWLVTNIGLGDCVHLDVFTCGDNQGEGSGSGYGCSSMCIFDSVNNINGNVNLVGLPSVAACACCN